MVEQLFGSKTRVKLLKLFFSNPNRSFYVREITRIVDEQINSVRRELANLLSLGLITSDSSNNKLYYEVDQGYEYFNEFRSMFSDVESEEESEKPSSQASAKQPPSKKATSKDEEIAQDTKTETVKPVTTKKSKQADDDTIELPEAKHWSKAGNITGIAYSGVYTRDESAAVDIVIIGDAVPAKIESVITELEKEKNKELRYAVISVDEWKYRGQVNDKFWLQVMAAKKQIVLDKDNVFSKK